MKTKPILYSAPMVKSLLNDTKTQTRRTKGFEVINENPDGWNLTAVFAGQNLKTVAVFQDADGGRISATCPYGLPGDVLWVREALYMDTLGNARFSADDAFVTLGLDLKEGQVIGWDNISETRRAVPSIHMPKTACRLWLKIKDIRVEQLNDINAADAEAEGVVFTDFGKNKWGDQNRGWHYGNAVKTEQCLGTAVYAFSNLWQSINGSDSWAANPYVWVIEFEKCDKPENF